MVLLSKILHKVSPYFGYSQKLCRAKNAIRNTTFEFVILSQGQQSAAHQKQIVTQIKQISSH